MTSPARLFAPIEFWPWDPDAGPASRYGVHGEHVLALLAEAHTLTWPQVERIGSLHAEGNVGPAGREAETLVREGIARAATAGGHVDAVDAAFAGGQWAVLASLNPVAGALELWWNNYPEVPAMDAVGFAAAAIVLGDALEPAVAERASLGWRHRDRLPDGWFGPNTPAVEAFLDEVVGLSDAQCERIRAAWNTRDPGRRGSFFWPRQDEWSRGLEATRAGDMRMLAAAADGRAAGRRVEIVGSSAWMRARTPETWWQQGSRDAINEYRDAIRAAAMALVVEDLEPALAAPLLEAWGARGTS